MIYLLEQALKETVGIRVPTDKPSTLINRLNDLRRENQEFADLRVYPSPDYPDKEVWIVKKGQRDAKSS